MKVGRNPNLVPDTEMIKALADLLTETGLTEIEYAVGDRRIRVARSLPAVAGTMPAAHLVAPSPVAVSTPEPSAPLLADNPGAVKSPMVGTAYLATQPGAAPFARIGDMVSEGQALLIIEAMKVMNQIRAPHSGRVAKIFVEDGSPVEFGTVLMLVE